MNIYGKLWKTAALVMVLLTVAVLVGVPVIGIFGSAGVRTVMYETTTYILVELASVSFTPEWASDMIMGWISQLPVNELIQSSKPQPHWLVTTWFVWIKLLVWLWILGLLAFTLTSIPAAIGWKIYTLWRG